MLMNTKEILQFLKISRTTLYKYMKDGMPVMRGCGTNSKLLFDRDEVIKWMKGEKND